MTFRSLIQMYSQSVKSGHSDPDLTKRQRQYLHVLLNLASTDSIRLYEVPIGTFGGDILYAPLTEEIFPGIET